jgi:hypothetical protein
MDIWQRVSHLWCILTIVSVVIIAGHGCYSRKCPEGTVARDDGTCILYDDDGLDDSDESDWGDGDSDEDIDEHNDDDNESDENSGDNSDENDDESGDANSDLITVYDRELCLGDSLIRWQGDVYVVGYGFGGGDDWHTTAYPAYENGGNWCFVFWDNHDVYRVTMWSGPDTDDWADLDEACDTNPHPFCLQRDDGYSLCFQVDGDDLTSADCSHA